MTTGSVPRSLILFSLPILFSDLLQQCYNAVDSLIVGRYVSTQALAAVGECFFPINILLGIFLGISLGCTVEISRFFGAKDKENLSTALDTTLKLTGIISVLFTVIGLALVPAFLKLVGTADDVYTDAKTYLTIYFGGIPAQIIYNMLAAILKAVGDSQRPLYVLMLTAVLNIVLDLLFIRQFNMGVAGAAYATIISQYIAAIVSWFVLKRNPAFENPLIRKQAINKDITLRIIKIGLPYSVQRSITAMSNTMVVSYVNYFGSDAMAAYSIYLKVDQIVVSEMLSLGSAETTYIAQNVGAGKEDRIKKGIKYSFMLSFFSALFLSAVVSLCRYKVTAIFTDDPGVTAVSVMFLTYLAPIHFINSLPQAAAAICRGRGDSLGPTIIMTFCFVVFRQTYLHIRWKTFKNLMIVVHQYYITWAMAAVLLIFYMIIKERRINKK